MQANGGMLGLLRSPAPRWLWLGQLASSAGDRLYAVALVWITAEATRSPAAVAIVSISSSVPQLITSLTAGRLIGSRSPLRVARLADLCRAVLVLGVPALTAMHAVNLAVLAVSAGVLSALEGLFIPALQASVPGLVARERLGPMIALLDSTDRLGRILGPGLVGLITLALPTAQLFTVDAVTFLWSAATLSILLKRLAIGREIAHARPRRAGISGWRAIAAHPVIGPGVALRTVCNLAWPAFTIAAPFLVQQRTSGGITGYGLLIATFGAANLGGSFLASTLRLPTGLQYRLAWAVAGMAFLLMALTQNYALLLATTALAGVCTPVANVTVDTIIASELSVADLADVYGTQRSLVTAAGIGGVVLLGAVEALIGPSGALAAAGLWMVIAVIGSVGLAARRGSATRR